MAVLDHTGWTRIYIHLPIDRTKIVRLAADSVEVDINNLYTGSGTGTVRRLPESEHFDFDQLSGGQIIRQDEFVISIDVNLSFTDIHIIERELSFLQNIVDVAYRNTSYQVHINAQAVARYR
jgi:hypothetical protein